MEQLNFPVDDKLYVLVVKAADAMHSLIPRPPPLIESGERLVSLRQIGPISFPAPVPTIAEVVMPTAAPGHVGSCPAYVAFLCTNHRHVNHAHRNLHCPLRPCRGPVGIFLF